MKVENSISVIICAYTEDRWNNLVAAVESVQQQTLPPQEIIVVIDHNPSLLRRAREHLSNVIVVENTEAGGASGSRNSGFATARGSIIACLDDDVVAIPDWLMFLSQGFNDPQVLGVGGAITPTWQGSRPAWFPEEFYWVVGCTYRGVPQIATAIRNLISANMALRREVIDTVGGFRSAVFMGGAKGFARREVFGTVGGFSSEIGRVGIWPIGCEETELCIRAQQQWPQSTFLYMPQASVSHNVPCKRMRWRYFCSRCFSEGLSKAMLTRYVGVKDGLASERIYTFRTLPVGIARGLSSTLLKHDLTGLLRAGAIVNGLAVTTAGYLVGSILSRRGRPLTQEKELRRSNKVSDSA